MSASRICKLGAVNESRTYALDPTTTAAVEALGNPIRVRILAYLASEGPSVRGRLAEDLDVNVKTMQFHLTGLRKLGVIHAQAIAPIGDWHRQEYVIDVQRYVELVDALQSAVSNVRRSGGLAD